MVTIFGIRQDTASPAREGRPQIAVASSRVDLLSRGLDVYAPCALGGAVDEDTIAALTAARPGPSPAGPAPVIICGAANNQLSHPGLAKVMADAEIVYAPDYVVNSGGVIQVADERHGFSLERARARAEQIFPTLQGIFASAAAEGVPPGTAADRLAEQRIAAVGRLRGIYLNPS